MSDEMKIGDDEKIIRASAVIDFVDMIRGAYDAGFIDNHPTNYDIYRSAQMHVKDRYGVETDEWDDELAKESRSDNHDRLVEENAKLREFVKSLSEARVYTVDLVSNYGGENEMTCLCDSWKEKASSILLDLGE